MKTLFEQRLLPTDERHSDFVDSFAYMVAAQEFQMREEYVLLHIKSCPWWIPEPIFHWLLSKLLVLSYFKS